MSDIEEIFDLLMSIREQAEREQKWSLLRAVERTENMAMIEFCGVDMTNLQPSHGTLNAEVVTSSPNSS